MTTIPKGEQPRSALHPSSSNHTHSRCDVLAFLEEPEKETPALRHGQKVANAFSGKVVLVHVMANNQNGEGPIDPVDWDIRKQKVLKELAERAQALGNESSQKGEVKLLEGQCLGQVSALMDTRKGDIAAALRPNDGLSWQMSKTACAVLTSRSAAILMIPVNAVAPPKQPYRRILVPLDGSVRAEAALPKAILLAKAEEAELMLCYVVPDSGVTEFGVKDQKSERLHSLVAVKNEEAGRIHLARIKNGLIQSGLKISTRIVLGGDPRRALIEFVAKESVDFLVMATHGQSGHCDVPTGDVARFVLDRVDIPVLMVRHALNQHNHHAFNSVTSEGVRQPAGTDG